MPKQPTNLSLPADLVRQAKALAKEQKSSVSAIVNRLLREFVAREKRKVRSEGAPA